jgi:hypothetical protein
MPETTPACLHGCCFVTYGSDLCPQSGQTVDLKGNNLTFCEMQMQKPDWCTDEVWNSPMLTDLRDVLQTIPNCDGNCTHPQCRESEAAMQAWADNYLKDIIKDD